MPSTPVGPPSTYRHTARPGFTHDVLMPSGKSAGSGGGQRFGRIVLVASVFRSRPIITTRHGVVISPRDRGRLAEPLAFLAAVAQLERIVQRLTMPETDHPAAAAVRLESHAAVVHEIGFGDRRVAAVLGQLERQRRTRPLSGLHSERRPSSGRALRSGPPPCPRTTRSSPRAG